jgi:hypothetical protein
MLNFFSFGLLSYYFLTLWLGFLYTFIYFNRVVYVIFPTTETTYKMVDGIDGDLYDDALYKYYGVKRPKNFYSGPRRNPKGRQFHSLRITNCIEPSTGPRTFLSACSSKSNWTPKPQQGSYLQHQSGLWVPASVNEPVPSVGLLSKLHANFNLVTASDNPSMEMSRQAYKKVVSTPSLMKAALLVGVIGVPTAVYAISQISHEEFYAFGKESAKNDFDLLGKLQSLQDGRADQLKR